MKIKSALNVLLVTALVAPLFLLNACCCPKPCEEKCPVSDKCGMNYTDGK